MMFMALELTRYQRFFGTGPRGLALGLASFALATWLAPLLDLGSVHGNPALGFGALMAASAVTVAIVFWAVKSLPPGDRGKKLTTTGAFKYFRHPLYAAFLLGFDWGFALYMDDWMFMLWAALQFPLWHWNIVGEERLMQGVFPGEYEAYAAKTGRFFPRISLRFW